MFGKVRAVQQRLLSLIIRRRDGDCGVGVIFYIYFSSDKCLQPGVGRRMGRF